MSRSEFFTPCENHLIQLINKAPNGLRLRDILIKTHYNRSTIESALPHLVKLGVLFTETEFSTQKRHIVPRGRRVRRYHLNKELQPSIEVPQQ